MSKPTIRIHDIATNEIVDREMNDDEYAIYLAGQNAITQIVNETTQKAADKAALLQRLGLTEDELKTILG
jgi:hypothetical protein